MPDETPFTPQGVSSFIDTAAVPEDSLAGAAGIPAVAGAETADSILEQPAAGVADDTAETGANDSDVSEGEGDALAAEAEADAEDNAPTIPRERLNAEAQKRREAEERLAKVEAELNALKPNTEAERAERLRQEQAAFERDVDTRAAQTAAQKLADTFGKDIVQQMTDEGIDYAPKDPAYITEFNARLNALKQTIPWVGDLYDKTLQIEKSAAIAQRDNTARAVQSIASEFEFHNPTVLENFAKSGASPDVLRAVAKDTHEYTAAKVAQVRAEFDAYKADEQKRIDAARAAGKQDAQKERKSAEDAPNLNGRSAAPPTAQSEWKPGGVTRFIQEGASVRL